MKKPSYVTALSVEFWTFDDDGKRAHSGRITAKCVCLRTANPRLQAKSCCTCHPICCSLYVFDYTSYSPDRRPLTLSPAHRAKPLRPAAAKNDMSNNDPKSWYSGIVLNRLTSVESMFGCIGGGGNEVRSCTIVDSKYIPCQGHPILYKWHQRARFVGVPSVGPESITSMTLQGYDLWPVAPVAKVYGVSNPIVWGINVGGSHPGYSS